MELPLVVENRLHDLAEWLIAWTTPSEPTPEQWNACRIFTHRGLHDDPRVPENTMASLAAVLYFEDIHGVEFMYAVDGLWAVGPTLGSSSFRIAVQLCLH